MIYLASILMGPLFVRLATLLALTVARNFSAICIMYVILLVKKIVIFLSTCKLCSIFFSFFVVVV